MTNEEPLVLKSAMCAESTTKCHSAPFHEGETHLPKRHPPKQKHGLHKQFRDCLYTLSPFSISRKDLRKLFVQTLFLFGWVWLFGWVAFPLPLAICQHVSMEVWEEGPKGPTATTAAREGGTTQFLEAC